MMAGDASAYAALGLEPGADSAAIERAYKRLIKKHHPDRSGGDQVRAAEINRAYRELRAGQAREALELHDDEDQPPRTRSWTIVMAAILVASAFLLVTSSIAPFAESFGAKESGPSGGQSTAAEDLMSQPLDTAGIDAAVDEAREMAANGDEMRLREASQRCHQELRHEPTLERLDRCAAFDDAVGLLQDRDPLRDRGPFSQLAVTGRQWNAASAISNDYLAIDGRLDRIRLRVELALAPPPPRPATVPVEPEPEAN